MLMYPSRPWGGYVLYSLLLPKQQLIGTTLWKVTSSGLVRWNLTPLYLSQPLSYTRNVLCDNQLCWDDEPGAEAFIYSIRSTDHLLNQVYCLIFAKFNIISRCGHRGLHGRVLCKRCLHLVRTGEFKSCFAVLREERHQHVTWVCLSMSNLSRMHLSAYVHFFMNTCPYVCMCMCACADIHI